MTEKRETAGGQKYPSRISIPVPRGQAPRVMDAPTVTPPAETLPPISQERTVETPIDLSGVTEIPDPVLPQRQEEAPRPARAPPPVFFPTSVERPEAATSVAAPPVFPTSAPPAALSSHGGDSAWLVADLRAEVAFYRKLVIALLGAVFLLTLFLSASLARGRG